MQFPLIYGLMLALPEDSSLFLKLVRKKFPSISFFFKLKILNERSTYLYMFIPLVFSFGFLGGIISLLAFLCKRNGFLPRKFRRVL